MSETMSLVDDLADVMSHMVVGWEKETGVDLAAHPEVQRVMARYRAMKATQEAVEALPPHYFDSDDHALHAGFLIGTLMKSGIHVIPAMDDQGNFMPDMEIVLPQEAGIPSIVIQIRVTG